MKKENKGKFFVGKIHNIAKKKGWFFGHFMDKDLLRSDLVEVAWQDVSNKKPSPQDKHYHKKSVEINIVISGWVRLSIDGKTLEVKKDEFYLVYPYTVVSNLEAGKNTQLIVIRAPSIEGDKYHD